MGYTTYLCGEFEFDRPLKPEHMEYLTDFSNSRRMMRNADILAEMDDPVRVSTGLPLGDDGGYFVSATGFRGQGMDESVVDFNRPPSGQPGLWCQWVPNEDGTAIVWDDGEKFYNYVEWLEYLIEHFLKPWGYVLNGSVSYSGEEPDDRGWIHVKDNRVQAIDDVITSPDPVWDDPVPSESVTE